MRSEFGNSIEAAMTETDYKALGAAILGALAVAAIGLIALAASAKTLPPDLLDICRYRGQCTWIEGTLSPPGIDVTLNANSLLGVDPLAGYALTRLNSKGMTISGNVIEGTAPQVGIPLAIVQGEALAEATCAEYEPVTGEEVRRWPVATTWFLGRFIDCDAEHLPSLWWRVKLRWREMLDGRQH